MIKKFVHARTICVVSNVQFANQIIMNLTTFNFYCLLISDDITMKIT